MGDKLYPFKEIASLAKLGESRARTLKDRYENVLPIEGEGRSRKYPKEAAVLLAFADKLEKSGKNPDEVIRELSAGAGVASSSDNRMSELARVIDQLSREVFELKRRDIWSRNEIIRLKRNVRSLSAKVDRLSDKKSLWEEFIAALVRFFDDLLSF